MILTDDDRSEHMSNASEAAAYEACNAGLEAVAEWVGCDPDKARLIVGWAVALQAMPSDLGTVTNAVPNNWTVGGSNCGSSTGSVLYNPAPNASAPASAVGNTWDLTVKSR